MFLFYLGTILGWISPAIAQLSSRDTPLVTGPLTYEKTYIAFTDDYLATWLFKIHVLFFRSEQISWVAAITSLGAMCGSLTFGFMAACLGCKLAMIFLALPSSVFWILIYFGNAYYHILLARYFNYFQCTIDS